MKVKVKVRAEASGSARCTTEPVERRGECSENAATAAANSSKESTFEIAASEKFVQAHVCVKCGRRAAAALRGETFQRCKRCKCDKEATKSEGT